MKTIGLIGGMSWESTIPYYRIINEEVRKRLGGLHSAKIISYKRATIQYKNNLLCFYILDFKSFYIIIKPLFC